MFARKLLHGFSGVVILGLLATSSMGAISTNLHRTTYFTFSKAVQLPGVSLPAGTYIFETPVANARDLVRVMARDRSQVYLTAFTRIVERPAGERLDPVITFAETSANTPPRINVWYPEGERAGRQFIY
jgi:hypothetical protein